ncbi:hypothetical protein BJ912DRAFT_1147739 [Pholiota molesta]|nr:hypothetical protein BJ912DRAFT_1147739 [Pholiota molesta]
MSFLLGPVSGAVVAGGIYYGFSNLMQTRTEQHIKDLHALSVRSSKHPPSASTPTRCSPHPTTPFLPRSSRNGTRNSRCLPRDPEPRQSAVEWGRSLLYGPATTAEGRVTSDITDPPIVMS